MVRAKCWSSPNLDWTHCGRIWGRRAENNLICGKIQGTTGSWAMIFVRRVYCTEASASSARARGQASSAREQGAADVTLEEAGCQHSSGAGGPGSTSGSWEGVPRQ